METAKEVKILNTIEIFFSQEYVLRIEIHTTNFQKVNIILPFPLCSELDWAELKWMEKLPLLKDKEI